MRGPPTFEGPAGRAWEVTRPTQSPEAWTGNIIQFQVNRPGAHPFWSWWVLSVVHLRDIPNVRPAHKNYPEAEYELLIVALDPEKPMPEPTPDQETPGVTYAFLTPVDVAYQFHGLTDDQAAELGRMAARTIVNGHLSPDQDYRQAWRATLAGTVEHLALGGHPTAKA